MSEIKKRNINPLAIILGLSAVLFAFFLIFSFVYFFMKGGDETWKSNRKGSMAAGDGLVALIEVKGMIMDSKRVLKHLKAAEEDDEIKAVLLRLNSPGGAVAPSQEIYEAVKRFNKPMVASMGSVAASGAYYIAAGAGKVYANGGTLTGSIGVIMEFLNLKKLYEWAKVDRYSIKTGKFKDSGADYRALNPEEQEYFQALVQDTLLQFKAAVAEGRNMTDDEVDAVADGRVFTGQQAKQLKLVDEIGTIDDALAYVAKEAKITGTPRLVRPARKSNPLKDLLMGGGGLDDEEGFEESYEDAGSFVDQIVSRIATRVTGVQAGSHQVRPAGLYMIWNGAL